MFGICKPVYTSNILIENNKLAFIKVIPNYWFKYSYRHLYTLSSSWKGILLGVHFTLSTEWLNNSINGDAEPLCLLKCNPYLVHCLSVSFAPFLFGILFFPVVFNVKRSQAIYYYVFKDFIYSFLERVCTHKQLECHQPCIPPSQAVQSD